MIPSFYFKLKYFFSKELEFFTSIFYLRPQFFLKFGWIKFFLLLGQSSTALRDKCI